MVVRRHKIIRMMLIHTTYGNLQGFLFAESCNFPPVMGEAFD
jgi:hypothetical protein